MEGKGSILALLAGMSVDELAAVMALVFVITGALMGSFYAARAFAGRIRKGA